MDYFEDRIACQGYGASCVSYIEEKMVERDLREQEKILKKASEERQREKEEEEAFGKIFESL